jgi:hypothetical protein
VMPITASMLYDLIACPHRVTTGLYAEETVEQCQWPTHDLALIC